MTRLLIAILLTGCAGSFEEAQSPLVGAAPPSEHCQDLDGAHALWSSMGKGSAAVAGGSGASMLISEVREDKAARIAVAGSAAVLAGWAVFSTHMAGLKAESWARDCSRE